MARGTKIIFYTVLVMALFTGVFVCMLNFLYPQKHKDWITLSANKYNLSPSLVASVINAESRYNEQAVSYAGAFGLMQIKLSTAEELAEKSLTQEELFDPELNIELGCKYLSQLLEQFGNLECALAGYNAGPNNVLSWLASETYSSDGQTLTDIPFKETRDYVQKVKNNIKIYTFLMK